MNNETVKNLQLLKYLLEVYMDLTLIKEVPPKDSLVQAMWQEITQLFTKLQGELNN